MYFKISKRKPRLIETYRGKEFFNNIFKNLLNNNKIKLYSRNTYLGAVFAERLNESKRNLLKKPVLEQADGNWKDIFPKITKHYNDRVHASTKTTPIQAFLKKNEGYVQKHLLDKRKKMKPKFQVNDLVRTADLKRTFSKGDTTNWYYKFYKITEIFNDTEPSYEIKNSKERYNKALLEKTELTMKENKRKKCYESLTLKLNQNVVVHRCL